MVEGRHDHDERYATLDQLGRLEATVEALTRGIYEHAGNEAKHHEHDVAPPVVAWPGFGAAVTDANQASIGVDSGDTAQLLWAARAGGYRVETPPGAVFLAADPRAGARLVLAENSSVVCATHDGKLINIGLDAPLGPNTLVEGFLSDGPDVRSARADAASFHGSDLATDMVLANFTFGSWPDEGLSYWGNRHGVPGRLTLYRVHFPGLPKHQQSDQRNTHSMLVGFQEEHDGDSRESQISVWESLIETEMRSPLVGDRATIHMVQSVVRKWTARGSVVRRSGLFKADGSVWDASDVSLDNRDEAIAAKDPSARIHVSGERFLGGASGVTTQGSPIRVPYDYPSGEMTDAEIADVISNAGARAA